MTQSRRHSLLESLTNTAVGFLISLMTWIIVAYAYGIKMTWAKNLSITGIFTVVSIVRGYCLRRIFNWWSGRVS